MRYKRFVLMLKDQIIQIRSGGLCILWRKVKKTGNFLFMNMAAPIAVFFKMDWPQAYDFLVDTFLKRIRKLRLQPDANKLLIDKLTAKSICYLEKNINRNPNLLTLPAWTKRHLMLASMYRITNKFKKSLNIYERVVEGQRNIAKRHQLNELGIEFVPRNIPEGSIGVYEYLEMNIKARMLDLYPKKKMILLVPPNAVVNNPCYLKYWSKYLTVISDPELIQKLAPLEALLMTPVYSFIHFRGKLYWSSLSQGTIREQWVQDNQSPFFTLTNEDHERGWNCLRSLGLPKDAWFVTLHVRESGWRDGHSREEDFRNADIKTYFPAIKTITDAGGWVIRIGDPGMSKLPSMPQVIDYAHSEVKSDWMDIFLCAQCRFMIGTSSGMCVVASSFGVPLVMTNLLPAYGVYHFTSRDVYLLRLCFSEKEGRYLSFSELISPPAGTATFQSHYDNRNLRVVENSSEEIKALVEEMLEKQDGILKYSEEDEILQKHFRKTTEECGKDYGDLNLVSNARIGRKFLHDHAELLSAEVMEDCQKQTDVLTKH